MYLFMHVNKVVVVVVVVVIVFGVHQLAGCSTYPVFELSGLNCM